MSHPGQPGKILSSKEVTKQNDEKANGAQLERLANQIFDLSLITSANVFLIDSKTNKVILPLEKKPRENNIENVEPKTYIIDARQMSNWYMHAHEDSINKPSDKNNLMYTKYFHKFAIYGKHHNLIDIYESSSKKDPYEGFDEFGPKFLKKVRDRFVCNMLTLGRSKDFILNFVFKMALMYNDLTMVNRGYIPTALYLWACMRYETSDDDYAMLPSELIQFDCDWPTSDFEDRLSPRLVCGSFSYYIMTRILSENAIGCNQWVLFLNNMPPRQYRFLGSEFSFRSVEEAKMLSLNFIDGYGFNNYAAKYIDQQEYFLNIVKAAKMSLTSFKNMKVTDEKYETFFQNQLDIFKGCTNNVKPKYYGDMTIIYVDGRREWHQEEERFDDF